MKLIAFALLAVVAYPSLIGKTAPQRPESSLGLLVPAYFYPDGNGLKEWDTLIAAGVSVPITAIVNPSSGPGRTVDPNYTRIMSRLAQAKIRGIGYVSTDYGKRPRAEVEADVDRWARFYPSIQGFFFDEQASGADQIVYYAALYRYAKSKIKNAWIVNNPGTTFDKGYLSRPAADAACIFETHTGFEAFRMPSWTRLQSPQKFVALTYQTPEASRMKQYARLAWERGIGYVYFTDDGADGNPWDRLPRYWNEELLAVREINRAQRDRWNLDLRKR